MRKLILYIAASLDGKIARKNGAVDWLPDPSGEDYGYQELYDSIDTTLMGYKTYQTCLGFGEWHFKDKTNWVFSRNQSSPCISEARLVSEDPVKFVRELKKESGKAIWLVGGGQLITLLHDAGLIDEYIIAFVPLILGEGIALFPEVSQQQNLILQKQQVFKNGTIQLYLRKSESFGSQ